MKYYTVYKITNLLDGRIYIGKHETYNLNDSYMGSGKDISIDKKKYGLENFKKEILFIFDSEEEMNQKEAELVTEDFCLREDTYNICPGGKGGWGYINQNGKRNGTEATTSIPKYRKMFLDGSNKGIIAQKKLWQLKREWAEQRRKILSKTTSERNLNLGNPFKGKFHTEETKARIGSANSLSQLGSKNSQFGSMWITNGIDNKKIKKTDTIPDNWHAGRKLNK